MNSLIFEPSLPVRKLTDLSLGGERLGLGAGVHFAPLTGSGPGWSLAMSVLPSPLSAQKAFASASEIEVGEVRVQVLTPHLVRIEERGRHGFENRSTFVVVSRPEHLRKGGGNSLRAGAYSVAIENGGSSAKDVRITDAGGKTIFQWDGRPIAHAFFPDPAERFQYWAFEDSPRIVPPYWGAGPAPEGDVRHAFTSGWDLSNDAPDIYVFLPGPGGYRQLRSDFLHLTGPIPLPPISAFGFWDSRYYEYTEKTALDTIDEYRKRNFPLDYFVIDTDWRINGSHGYDVEKKDFPDMRRFIREAHGRHVHLMFNDHPEPVSESALDPKELRFRADGLTKLLNWGADVWWYDRNWTTHLHEPAPGISKEVWGARLFHDITLAAKPDRRPMIMSNVEGINNGKWDYPPSPAFHRFPIWWTGDTWGRWNYLRDGVSNGINSGVLSLLPYDNEDLGGHFSAPSTELYVRFLQFGALSPITRVHCSKGYDRHPWNYGPAAEKIARDYLQLRYRLLPTIYSAARRAYDDGTPLMRRCDLEWPEYPEAADSQQFLLGDDLLVAPICVPANEPEPIGPEMLKTPAGEPGLAAEYYSNMALARHPHAMRHDPTVDFEWNGAAPVHGMAGENFSARWTGRLGPVPQTGKYTLAVRVDDGCRLYLDHRLIIDDWRADAERTNTAEVELKAGHSYELRLEYFQLGGDSCCHLEWITPSHFRPTASRTVWIPPGVWEDVWTGKQQLGPKTITVSARLTQAPIFVRRGGIILQAPFARYVGEKPWDPITIDFYPGRDDGQSARTLYEDDGVSNRYLEGAYRLTGVSLTRERNVVRLQISPSEATFHGALTRRGWVLRAHLNPGEKPQEVELDGKSLAPSQWNLLKGSNVSMPFLGPGSNAADEVLEVTLPAEDVKKGHELSIYL